MTDCHRVRELLGGHALGALEPEEAERAYRHLAECPECARQHDSLVEAASLLDLLEATDVPLPAPPPELEQALLDRHSRARRRAPDPRPRRRRAFLLGAKTAVTPAAAPRARTRPRRSLLLGAMTAATVVAIVAVMSGPGRHSPASSAEGGVSLAASAAAPGAAGRAELRSVAAGTGVRLSLEGLDPRPGVLYTLWCVRDDGSRVSGGSFRPDSRGRAEASLTAAVRRGEYGRVLVTSSRTGGRARRVLAGTVEYE